ncbi:MAG TPA: hypothetical protein VEY07_01370, partial [Thermoplasmata archaeon]|nr:hypothetical protein [Thermoplasmata archaeon]
MASSVPQYDEWLDESTVEALGHSLGDPASVRSARTEALRAFRELPLEPNPLYRKYGYFAGVDLAHLNPSARGPPTPPPPAQPGTVQIVHDAAGTRVALPPELASRGVAAELLPDVWAAGDSTAEEFFRVDRTAEDRLSALALAVINRGYRLTIPEHLEAPVRVQDITVLSAPHEGLSVHRSVSVGAGSRLLFSEECYSTSEPDHQRRVGSSVQLTLGDGGQASYLAVHAPDARAIGLYSRRATLGRASRLGW